jgi:hypothetical protein
LTPAVLGLAQSVAEIHAVRAYDAVQLAAALEVDRRRAASGLQRLTLVSSDSEMNAVAAVVGLAVDDPNLHP